MELKETSVVYIMAHKSLGILKIGVTSDLKRRLATVSNDMGYDLKMVYHTKPLKDAFKLERELHKIFKNNRWKGEWFELSHVNILAEVEKIVKNYETSELYDLFKKGLTSSVIAKTLKIDVRKVDRLTDGLCLKEKDLSDYKRLLRKYNLSDAEIGQMFGYSNPASWSNSSAKKRLENQVVSIVWTVEGKIKDKI